MANVPPSHFPQGRCVGGHGRGHRITDLPDRRKPYLSSGDCQKRAVRAAASRLTSQETAPSFGVNVKETQNEQIADLRVTWRDFSAWCDELMTRFRSRSLRMRQTLPRKLSDNVACQSTSIPSSPSTRTHAGSAHANVRCAENDSQRDGTRPSAVGEHDCQLPRLK